MTGDMILMYSYSYIFTIIGYIMNSQLTIYPCGWIAQWIEHCTGIARSWVQILFKPEGKEELNRGFQKWKWQMAFSKEK